MKVDLLERYNVFAQQQTGVLDYFQSGTHHGKLARPEDYVLLFPIVSLGLEKRHYVFQEREEGVFFLHGKEELEFAITSCPNIEKNIKAAVEIILYKIKDNGIAAFRDIFGSFIIVKMHFIPLLRSLDALLPGEIYGELLNEMVFPYRVNKIVAKNGKKNVDDAERFILKTLYENVEARITENEYHRCMCEELPTYFPSEWVKEDYLDTIQCYVNYMFHKKKIRRLLWLISYDAAECFEYTTWDCEYQVIISDGIIFPLNPTEYVSRAMRVLYELSLDEEYKDYFIHEGWFDSIRKWEKYINY